MYGIIILKSIKEMEKEEKLTQKGVKMKGLKVILITVTSIILITSSRFSQGDVLRQVFSGELTQGSSGGGWCEIIRPDGRHQITYSPPLSGVVTTEIKIGQIKRGGKTYLAIETNTPFTGFEKKNGQITKVEYPLGTILIDPATGKISFENEFLLTQQLRSSPTEKIVRQRNDLLAVTTNGIGAGLGPDKVLTVGSDFGEIYLKEILPLIEKIITREKLTEEEFKLFEKFLEELIKKAQENNRDF